MFQDSQCGGGGTRRPDKVAIGRPAKGLLAEMFAYTILGRGFIPPQEVVAANLGMQYNLMQCEELKHSIPGAKVLSELQRGCYGLVPQPPKPMSLLDIRHLVPELFQERNQAWYEQNRFPRNDRTREGWLAVRAAPLNGSVGKPFAEQCSLVGPEDWVPNVAEVAWFASVFFRVRRIRLYSAFQVRTASRDDIGRPVDVGQFNVDGMMITSFFDYYECGLRGLAVARKL